MLTIYHFIKEEFEDTKRGNQNPYIEEEQTTQWPKEKDKQRSKTYQNLVKTETLQYSKQISLIATRFYSRHSITRDMFYDESYNVLPLVL